MSEQAGKTVTYSTTYSTNEVAIEIKTSDGQSVSFIFDSEQTLRFGMSFVRAAHKSEVESNG
jgi:hypothetical protein